ncbi:MAG TPA: class I SAM-dependent methyltransferase [Conexibacter sp.]|nr:class I SAM-dependent methyltransferase [Conexibacter sp.]
MSRPVYELLRLRTRGGERRRLTRSLVVREVEVRFLSFRGRRVAYAVSGDGPALVVPAWWVSHLELNWRDRAFRSFWAAVGEGRTLVRYDGPGVGMSDRDGQPQERTLETEIALPAVRDAIVATVRSHWGLGSRVPADIFLGDAGAEERERFARLQRAAASAETAAALLGRIYRFDVRAELERVRAPTQVVHRRSDRAIPPFGEDGLARRCAAGDARRMVVAMSTVNVKAPPTSGLWTRVFAAVYDSVLWASERAGMRARRRELLRHARGRTVELGSGTGLNLPHYPDDLDELILTEPSAAMAARLERKLRRSRRTARVLAASAERLPFDDRSVDTVVSTLVLCTVDEPDRALQEIARVLRPDGQLLFIEHVRSESPRLAAWQDRLAGPWQRFAEGCRCNRATVELIAAGELAVDDVREESWRGVPRIVRPLASGRARPRSAASDPFGHERVDRHRATEQVPLGAADAE